MKQISLKVIISRIVPIVVVAFSSAACSTGESVEYQVAKNYFYAGRATAPATLKITTHEEFEKSFGMAATMGDDGAPKAVDFSKQFVIAKVVPPTDRDETLTPVSLVKQPSGKLLLTYKDEIKGEKRSFSIQPCFLLIVDKKYADCEVEEKKE